MPDSAAAEMTVSPEAFIAIRRLRGWTQATAAAAIGIDRSQLWRIETGRAVPYEHTLRAAAQAYGVPATSLMKPA